MAEQNKDIVEEVKKHPVIKVIGAVLTFATLVITGFITVDERYAHAGDIKELKAQQAGAIMYLKDENAKSILEMRKRAVEDKIFELNLKERQSTADKALVKRYEAESKNVDEKIIQLEQANKSRAIRFMQ